MESPLNRHRSAGFLLFDVHLIRIFDHVLPLYCAQFASHNNDTAHRFGSGGTANSTVGGLMGKMAIFLGGFLVLTILIGVLATISPV